MPTAPDPDLEEWQLAEIQAGVDEADHGEFGSADDVAGVFAKYSLPYRAEDLLNN